VWWVVLSLSSYCKQNTTLRKLDPFPFSGGKVEKEFSLVSQAERARQSMMLKIYITWSSCCVFRLHCLDYDVRKSEIMGHTAFKREVKNTYTFWSGYLKGKELVVRGQFQNQPQIGWLKKNTKQRTKLYYI